MVPSPAPTTLTALGGLHGLLRAAALTLVAGILAGPFAQPPLPAFAQSGDGASAGAAPAATAPLALRSIEERHWIDLVRACSANAKHLRLHLPGRVVETDHVELEDSGVRFRAPHAFGGSGGLSEPWPAADTLVAWADLSKVEVRNVATAGEAAATGTVVGLAIGLPVALVAGLGAALSFQKQDSRAGSILLGAAALGLVVGAVSTRPRNGGWATCCERDTTVAASGIGDAPAAGKAGPTGVQ